MLAVYSHSDRIAFYLQNYLNHEKNIILDCETPRDPKFFEFTLISHPGSPNEYDGTHEI